MATEHNYSLAAASQRGNEHTPVQFEDFDDVIIQFMKDQGIPGISLAISYHGNVVYKQGYGTAGVNRPMTSSSRLRIASISKPLTAIGVMRLVEEGHLTLEDKVFGPKGILNDFRPASKGDKRMLNITVQHLLQHSAGWDRDQAGDPVFFNLDAIDVKDGFVSTISDAFNVKLVKYMMKRKLQFAPGKRHAYSNFGYLVLGLVMEKITGMRYEAYMRKLFINMGLPRLRVGCTKRVLCDVDEVEYFNNREPTLLKSIFPNDGLVLPQYGSFSMENTGAYGGWVASTGDLMTILHMLQSAIPDRVGTLELDRTGTWSHESRSEPEDMTSSPCGKFRAKEKRVDDDTSSRVYKQVCQLNDQGSLSRNVEHHGYDLNSTEVKISPRQDKMVEVQFNDKEGTSEDMALGSKINNEISDNSSMDVSAMSCSDCQAFTSFGIPILDRCRVTELPEEEQGMKGIGKKHQLPSESAFSHRQPVLRSESVLQLLERPKYEDGKQWYGLGLDVQDSGLSFGHTGAMEGSCGTLRHHKSGFSWVLLMNSWSRDMDLDGLVKYALSTVKGYPLYFEVDKVRNIHEVISQDEQEKVLLLVPHSELETRGTDAQSSGFTPSWISGCNINSVVYFNLILRKSSSKWCMHIDITRQDVSGIEKEEKNRSYLPYFLESYTLSDDVVHCILFREDLDCMRDYQILPSVPAKEYLRLRKDERKHSILCQSVATLNGELYVSALFKYNRVSSAEICSHVTMSVPDIVTWLQISAEEFLVEQKKQLKKGRELLYVKFYSLGGDPFVSGVWSSSSAASDRLQRHGASRYGLLQELREAASRNVRLQACSSYMSEGVVNFAALWNPADAER